MDQISAATLELIMDHNRFDVELYHYAQGLFDERVKRHADRIKEELYAINRRENWVP
jgi:hypothetical protein